MATEEDTINVAVIGAGFLGARIITEMLLLGNNVAVFDANIAKQKHPQTALNEVVGNLLLESDRQGLLGLAEMAGPKSGKWTPYADEPPRQAKACLSVAEAATNAHIVLEAVPDKLEIKSKVFAEAVSTARPGAILATNTLSIPLKNIQEAVMVEVAGSGPKAHPLPAALRPRVMGLRFLSPVVFIPFVEVTLSSEQEKGIDKEDLTGMLRKWGKACFICDIQGAVDNAEQDKIDFIRVARERLRLDTATAQRRQVIEAKLRATLRMGPEAASRTWSSDLFKETKCCICLDEKPTVPSMLCGHVALCEDCAGVVESGTKQCPMCRERFVRRM
ncbi:lcdH [Symbiodinium natans]|uniref:LcdH protein n=1 Tax=Symbiodinium natans TaxID=878477 RepID=A0A812TW77_9DINO|nr:lcdH [Symbiodinium natans]